MTNIYRALNKLKSQRFNDPMTFYMGRSAHGKKKKKNTHEEMLNILAHKGNANQNLTPVRKTSIKNTNNSKD
jgi:hypothetical protein